MDSRIHVEGWRKMEAAAQKRAEDGEEWSVAAYVPATGATRLKSSKLSKWNQMDILNMLGKVAEQAIQWKPHGRRERERRKKQSGKERS